MLIRSAVIAYLYLAWDRKLGLLSLARSVNSSKRRRPGMGHLLGKKKKTKRFLNQIHVHKEEREEKMFTYSPLRLEMELLKEAPPPILKW